ncbi:hypothetical protein EN741_31675, partial [Mesorhizobium sp. M4B.F.Ca.ET.019.03.1.1]
TRVMAAYPLSCSQGTYNPAPRPLPFGGSADCRWPPAPPRLPPAPAAGRSAGRYPAPPDPAWPPP